MRRKLLLRVGTAVATAAVVVAGVALSMTTAAAQTTGATGYATQNGGTDGGAGGQVVQASSGTDIHEALCNRASTDTPVIIQVSGTINHGNTSDVDGDSCDTADDVIELKGVSNISIIGVGGGATFDQIGIHIRDSSNIIIQNVTVKNVKKSGSPTSNGGDAIGMESGVRNVWVDHVTLEASGGESEGYDGLFDMKNDTKYVTLSYSILRGSDRGGLIGSGDSDTDNSFVTFHHNLYDNLKSRVPLLRAGTAHTYNNHFTGIWDSGINSRVGAKVKVDNNYFEDSKDVLGTYYTDSMGYWQVSGNVFDNVTWSAEGSDSHPAGPNPTSTTTVSIPYSYPLDQASCVPSIVAETAGANKGLKVSDGNCSAETPSEDPDDPTTDPDDPTTDPGEEPGGENLSLSSDAGADGSGKASGTSYGNVIDGDMGTYWSPSGSTGRVSVKWDSAKTVSAIVIREASGAEGNIGSWQVVNHANGDVLASGSGAGTITFSATSLKKINFVITSASGTPRIAEFETYASSAPGDGDPTDPDDPTTPPDDDDPTDPPAGGDELYVAPNGSSNASGTQSDPTSLVSAIDRIDPGGRIYVRGGTYNLSSTVHIEPGNDGSSGNRTELFAYSGETPVLNFSAQSEDSANRGLAIGGDWWHIRGIIVEHAGDNGILLGGNSNIIERVVTRHNADTGLQIARYTAGAPSSEWPSNNLILSSESHDNVDSDGEDADGFAAKLTSGDGNVFRYCVAHNNIDDGWDLYTKDDTGPIGEVTIEDSLSYDNGTLSNGGQAGNGDRNGFKLGGEDIAVDHTVVRSIAIDNGKHGFTYNSNPGSMTISNNLAIGNGERNFNFDEGSHVFRGNTSCDSGSNDRIVGNSDSSNQWDTGSNGSRCSQYSGSLGWSFGSGGALTVTLGGDVVDL
ncbi:right-handed parallel beta-helix repeat-containing protein [Glycomyces sp. A-F 0318]|uniref:pectate lyase family protein n=1 Tax=Glycomyces amatae TaxID=2881355 RepID=UPI001E4CEC66|nr:right-handed parallel beta-helix repeat-containing protein [Glycomyces amatae]MCD0446827.1 right-handed parallel beta-helix repeat-containing protein [Glycomyces amatae]